VHTIERCAENIAFIIATYLEKRRKIQAKSST
jgi:hypothetical protein